MCNLNGHDTVYLIHNITLFRLQVKKGEHYIRFHQPKNEMHFQKQVLLHYCEHRYVLNILYLLPVYDLSLASQNMTKATTDHTTGVHLLYTFQTMNNQLQAILYLIVTTFLSFFFVSSTCFFFSIRITFW